MPEHAGVTVAFDANPATRTLGTGTERYARELALRLAVAAPELRWVFYASRPAPGMLLDLTVLPHRRLWSQVWLPVELWRTRPALCFAPSHVVPFGAPGKALTTVHDLAFERFPDAYGPAQLAYLRLSTRWAALRCPRLLVVSEATRRDLAELYGVDPARVEVVHPGGGEAPPRRPRSPHDAGRLAALGVSRPFALHVGRVEARKNQLAALAAVERQSPGLGFVSAGPVRDAGMAARLAASPRARVLGSVSSDDLELLYGSASVLIFPSLYEGFGLPVLEALRRGLPVVCARVSSLPEVAGEAAFYVDDPRDEVALAAAVRQVLEDVPTRRRLVREGRNRARRFTWDRCAEGVAKVVRELCA